MRLVHEATGIEPVPGEELTDFRGDKAIFVSSEKPRHGGSTGRVYVKPTVEYDNQTPTGYYPSVFNLKWIEREDQDEG